MHPFDADGLVNAIQFKDGKASFRNRFVLTKGYKKERLYRKICYRGAFGTQRKGGFLSNFLDINIKNVANTNVIYWGERLLALWEGGLPHRMEADSLRTLGEYTFRGLLKKGAQFSAHPRVDSKSGKLVNFAVNRVGQNSLISIYEFDKDLKVEKEREFQIPGFVFMHDFVVTEKYYIFNKAPIKFDPVPFLLGFKGPASCLDFNNSSPATIYIVPRDGGKIKEVAVDSHFNFHFANAYEQDDEIIFDIVRCSQMQLGAKSGSDKPIWMVVDYGKEVPYTQLVRYTLKSSSDNEFTYSTKLLSDSQVDFTSVAPAVSCQSHRYIYGACGSSMTESTPPQGLVKIDCEDETKENEQKWLGEKYEWLGETIFAPKPNGKDEDDGFLLSYLFNGLTKSSELVIFDAKDIQPGPICRLALPTNVPTGLHGTWVPDLTFDEDDISRRWKATRALDSKTWNEVNSDFSGLGISYDM